MTEVLSLWHRDSGIVIEEFFPKSLYEASKLSELSLGSLRNAASKGNRVIVRRRDKQPFKITWCSSHKVCFPDRKERERMEFRKKLDEEVAKKKEEGRRKKKD